MYVHSVICILSYYFIIILNVIRVYCPLLFPKILAELMLKNEVHLTFLLQCLFERLSIKKMKGCFIKTDKRLEKSNSSNKLRKFQ